MGAAAARKVPKQALVFVLSPAKALNLDPLPARLAGLGRTAAAFPQETQALVQQLQGLKAPQLKSLMKISDALATLNASRYAQWSAADEKQAILAFDGAAFKGLGTQGLSAADCEYLQEHLVVLSGLYGCLRPLDAIKPYRLEMGTKLENPHGPNLYSYWGTKIAQHLAERGDEGFLVNVASAEYWKSVDLKALPQGWRVVQIGFPGPAIYAKEARGAIVRYACDLGLEGAAGVEALKGFTGNNGEWAFAADKSDELVGGKAKVSLVFERNAAKGMKKLNAPSAGKGPKKRKR